MFHDASQPFTPDTDIHSISVEVLSIQGTAASPISRDSHVLYESEVLAIVHRYKSNSSGLVGTTVWAWRGNKGHLGEREERKLQELARRYNTSLVSVARAKDGVRANEDIDHGSSIRRAARVSLCPWRPSSNSTGKAVKIEKGGD